MSGRFHVNPVTGDYGPCHASKGKCPFGGVDGDDNHYSTKSEAQSASEAWHESHAQATPLRRTDALDGFVPIQVSRKCSVSVDDDEHEEAERITGLGRDKGAYATALDADGRLDHTTELIWNDDAPVNDKLTFLAFYQGRRWREAHPDDEEFGNELGDAITEYYGSSEHGAVHRDGDSRATPCSEDIIVIHGDNGQDRSYHQIRRIADGVGIGSLGYFGDHNNVPRWAEIVAEKNCGSPKHVEAMIYRSGPQGRLPTVLVTSGTNYNTRGVLSKTSCKGVLNDGDGSSSLDVASQTFKASEEWYAEVSQIDADALIGWHQVRKTLKESQGVDIRDFNSGDDLGRIEAGLDSMASMESNAHRQAVYDRESETGKIATAFTDKIKTSRQCEEAAKDTRLHQVFDHIEFDEDTDLKKLPQMEDEIIIAMEHLPKTSKPLTALRVRKLGKHRENTMGLYSPVYNAIALDDGMATRNGYSGMAAFIHEYAHHLDYTMDEAGRNVSMSEEFRPVVEAVNANINKQSDLKQSYQDYLKTPTEVFSRCFEWWAVKKLGVKSSLTNTEEEYDTAANYTAFKGNEELIDNVMSKLFPDMKGFNTLDKSGWGR